LDVAEEVEEWRILCVSNQLLLLLLLLLLLVFPLPLEVLVRLNEGGDVWVLTIRQGAEVGVSSFISKSKSDPPCGLVADVTANTDLLIEMCTATQRFAHCKT
jgi:hypothetical protein